MKKHFLSAVRAALLLTALAVLISCGGEDQPGQITDAVSETVHQTQTAPGTESETVPPTAAPVTEAVTEPAAETTAEAVTEAETEASAPVYPAVIADNGRDVPEGIAPAADGVYPDPLTGTAVAKEEAERRPVAIMLNNIKQALPQQNIGAADVLYECQVEGYLTRLLGVFNDYADLDAIGSVRSAREYFIDFAANHDAVFVHAGGSEEAYRNLKSRKINNLDAVNDGTVSGYFYRDPNRLGRMGYEHTLVIDGEKVDAAIASKRYRTSYASAFDNPLSFVGEGQKIDLTDGTKAKQLTVKFGAHTTQLVYNAAQNRYMRWQNSEKHIDSVTGEQLGYENVIVLFCPYTMTEDSYGHIEVASTGSGRGYYLTGGKKTDIQWSKSSGDAQIRLTYAGGREVLLTPGKTNFEIVGYESAVTVIAE